MSPADLLYVKELEKAVLAGLQTPGFSFIEALVTVSNRIRAQETSSNLLLTTWTTFARIRCLSETRPVAGTGRAHSPDMYIVGELARRNRPALG